nr:hypothetical protein [uncultured bacterium]
MNLPAARLGWRAAIAAPMLVLLGACTTIKLNHDNTNSITYKGGPEVGQQLATRACRKAGERSAIIISTVNKDPSLPPGTGRQVATFRCSSDEAPATNSG